MEFARSKSGHDKNQIYLIKEKDEKFVYLVNGTTRTLDMPKKKMQSIFRLSKSTDRSYGDFGRKFIRSYSKRAIKQYCQMNDGRQES